MGNVQLKDIPGLTEALEEASKKEAFLRDLPFLDVTLEICGIEVKQFTPRHFILLDVGGSPFLQGGKITAEAVAQFLWVVSVDYCGGDKSACAGFARKIVEVGFDDAVTQIGEYLDEAFFDRPSSSSKSSAAVTSFLATLVDLIAGCYGWTREYILEKPFAELYQYVRRIQLRDNPSLALVNRFSDKVRRESVLEYLSKQRGEPR